MVKSRGDDGIPPSLSVVQSDEGHRLNIELAREPRVGALISAYAGSWIISNMAAREVHCDCDLIPQLFYFSQHQPLHLGPESQFPPT